MLASDWSKLASDWLSRRHGAVCLPDNEVRLNSEKEKKFEILKHKMESDETQGPSLCRAILQFSPAAGSHSL